ncbi:Holliday junction branch migration protein RuvA [Myxococcota bacterium]
MDNPSGTRHSLLGAEVIGRLRGHLALEEPDGRLIVDVGGVGYEVATPVGTVGRARSGDKPEEVLLHIHTQVREDAFELYGFAAEGDRQLFRLLLAVQKVGPKLALGLLSALAAEEVIAAIRGGDISRLCRVPGIGRKTAERVVLELREKVGVVWSLGSPPANRQGDVTDRLMAALVNMGYKSAEAERAVKSLGDAIGGQAMADSLRAALAALTQRHGG